MLFTGGFAMRRGEQKVRMNSPVDGAMVYIGLGPFTLRIIILVSLPMGFPRIMVSSHKISDTKEKLEALKS
jgi:hypothetical protein